MSHFVAFCSVFLLALLFTAGYSSGMGRVKTYSVIYSLSRARAGRHAWLLVTPAGLSTTGKRRQQAFATEREAKQALRQAQAAQAVLGEQVRHVNTDPAEQAQWLRDRRTAEAAGLTTTTACGFAAQCVAEFGSLQDTLKLARWAQARAMQAWPDVYLADAFTEYREATSGLSPFTLKNRVAIHRRLMREAFEFCMNTPLHQLSSQNVTELLTSMQLPPTSWNLYVTELHALLSWAQTKGYVDPDRHPLRHVKKRPVKEAEIRCLQPAQLAELLRCACSMGRPEVALYVAICAFAGVRPTECRRLVWADVGTEEDWLSVRSGKSKTGGARHITLRPVLRKWLDYLCPPAARNLSGLITAGLNHILLQKLHIAAGLRKWPRDVLRHSFASYSIKAGTPLHEVQSDMGHVGLDLLRSRYLNMAGLTKAGAAEWWSMTPDKVLK